MRWSSNSSRPSLISSSEEKVDEILSRQERMLVQTTKSASLLILLQRSSTIEVEVSMPLNARAIASPSRPDLSLVDRLWSEMSACSNA